MQRSTFAMRAAHITRSAGAAHARLISVALFALALAPRALAPGGFVTVDEAYHWFARAGQFLSALERADYAGTSLAGHPGVTTLWLGTIGLLAQRLLVALGWIAASDPDGQRVLLRLPVAIVTALAVALAYPLLRRLVGQRAALLAALVWAADPFLVAHAHLLHLDALLASFMTLALLAAMVAFHFDAASGARPIRWRMLIASGVASGLAFLTKSPSIWLLPMVGLVAIVGCWQHADQETGSQASAPRLLAAPTIGSRIVLAGIVWAGVALAVWVALWPAAWVDLPGAVARVVQQASADGGSPHGWGNFFLGRAVADPGPLFYPLAIALRMTPWTLIGLGAAIAALIRQATPQRRVIVLLGVFALGFTLMMSIPPKKFDRYVLPIFPVLDILAAIGLLWLAEALRQRRTENREQRTESREQRIGPYSLFVVLCSLFLLANLAWYHPYELAYYNPLLGGGPVAARTIPVGWGEGLELAGRYITEQPDGCDRPVATWFGPVLQPYVCSPVVPLQWALQPGKVDYVVLYIDQIQRNDAPEVTARLLGKVAPVHTVWIHGIAYAYIYQLPAPVAHARPADFGSGIHLVGYDLDISAVRASGALTLTLQWQARDRIPADYSLFVHVLDGRGKRVGQVDVPPGGARAPTSAWRPGHYIRSVLRVPVRADLPAGTYWIALGIYDPHSFARLPLRAPPPPGAPDDGADALVLEPIALP